ncbi:hypothetical protein [uncultured Helicobacter sp.]|uniref:hypothetical protein n=1 Tax=uncultured Helicobacter sp. TaxID=175537 RepID=UPI00374FC528
MNCITHNDVPAVASCQHCNVGLCSECVHSFLQTDNKPLCKNCSKVYVDANLEMLHSELAGLKTKKIIWSIILVLGALLIVFDITSATSSGLMIVGILVWSLAGFIDRFRKKRENPDVQWAIKSSVIEGNLLARGDSTIWFYWLGNFLVTLTIMLIRGIFFPFFYLYFMLTADKKVKTEIARIKELGESLN